MLGKGQLKYLKENMECEGLVHDGNVISVELPAFVELEVTETDPGFKGDTAQGATKSATLETGAVVQVPLFIETGDVLKIDRREDKYLTRVSGMIDIEVFGVPDPGCWTSPPSTTWRSGGAARASGCPSLQAATRSTPCRRRTTPWSDAARAAAPTAPGQEPPLPAESASANLVEITSPMVGTFYRAPSPEAAPYVEVGSTVAAGDVLCVIEAMKLMNELECETSGRIVEICVDNAEPVDFGQVLFRVDPA